MPEPAFIRHNAEHEVNRALFRARGLLVAKSTVYILSTFCLIGFIFFTLPGALIDDLKGKPLQETEGTIMGFSFVGKTNPPREIIRLRDGEVTYHVASGDFFTGQKVRVFYFSGSTGKVYVARLEPVREEKSALGIKRTSSIFRSSP